MSLYATDSNKAILEPPGAGLCSHIWSRVYGWCTGLSPGLVSGTADPQARRALHLLLPQSALTLSCSAGFLPMMCEDPKWATDLFLVGHFVKTCLPHY